MQAHAAKRKASTETRLENKKRELADERAASNRKKEVAIGPAASLQKEQADVVKNLQADIEKLR